MKKIILSNILLVLFFIGCSSSSVEYTPAVIYLKAPEAVIINGNNKTYFEFAVSDLNELEGTINLIVTDSSGNKLLDKKLEKLLFSTDGTVISFYSDKINTSDKLNFNFKVCNTENLCREQSFTGIEINTASQSDEIDIKGKLISDNDSYGISIHLSSMINSIALDDNGNFSIDNINSGKYDLYTKGKELKNGFYRYIYLKYINFNKSTNIFLYIPIDENEEYDEPLVNCSYSSGNKNTIYMVFFMIFMFVILRKNEKR